MGTSSSKTLLFVNISPTVHDLDETVSALRWATRAKHIRRDECISPSHGNKKRIPARKVIRRPVQSSTLRAAEEDTDELVMVKSGMMKEHGWSWDGMLGRRGGLDITPRLVGGSPSTILAHSPVSGDGEETDDMQSALAPTP